MRLGGASKFLFPGKLERRHEAATRVADDAVTIGTDTSSMGKQNNREM